MRNEHSNYEHTPDAPHHHIPDIEIIDLELDGNSEKQAQDSSVSEQDISEETEWDEDDYEAESGEKRKFSYRSFLNVHVLLLVVFILFVVCIFLKFKNWGQRIDISQIEHDNSGQNLDVLDQILPLTDENGKMIATGDVKTILAFGNAPFADDRDSADNLANLIADSTGATVYNCSVSGSYLAAQQPNFMADKSPMDVYCFYWLVALAIGKENTAYFEQAAAALGENTPPEAQEVVDTLTAIDLNTVDVITVMYDASDYLMGHEMYDDANSTNIQQFTGNLEAGIEFLQSNYPNIRIIVMSPTYAYAVDEEGNYVSSDMYRYGQDVLSTYVIKEYSSCADRSVSFIDNLYGTITEDNAKEYLTDNLHLNVAGRKLVAERFLKVLNYYNQ